jgi:PhnB protein
MTNPVPDGFHTLSAHLIVPGGARAIELYKQAFGAQEQVVANAREFFAKMQKM